MLAERYDTKPNLMLGGSNPSLKRPTCLAIPKSCDTMKQSVFRSVGRLIRIYGISTFVG